MVSLKIMKKMPTFARCPEVRSHSNHKYIMCWYIAVLHLCNEICPCFLELKYCSQNILSLPNVRVSDEWTFKRVLVVGHNAHESFRDTCFQKNDHSHFYIACRWQDSDRNCTFRNFCRVPYDWDNLANGILRCHKLPGVFTEVSEYMHVVFNIKIEVFLFFSAWVGGGGVRLCVSCTSQR